MASNDYSILTPEERDRLVAARPGYRGMLLPMTTAFLAGEIVFRPSERASGGIVFRQAAWRAGHKPYHCIKTVRDGQPGFLAWLETEADNGE